jgi:hypothetical protein
VLYLPPIHPVAPQDEGEDPVLALRDRARAAVLAELGEPDLA